MKNLKRILNVSLSSAAVVAMLSACGPSRSIGQHPPDGAPLMNGDRQVVMTSEQSLESVGLRFQVETDAQGVKWYKWNMRFFRAFRAAHPGHPTKAEVKVALRSYVVVANSYLDGLSREQQSDAVSSISSPERNEVIGKISFAKRQLRNIGEE